ncbi:hypothetical protein ACFSM5_19590 [Lacibacterium aquatile]|uniref:Uncharacterized protein n=1 Tax=Lacibacterium aquatile TaxID=1168082 RepID=A0ABW5DW83_9PROT
METLILIVIAALLVAYLMHKGHLRGRRAEQEGRFAVHDDKGREVTAPRPKQPSQGTDL